MVVCEPSFDKFSYVFDLVLPVLEAQVNVVAQFVDNLLCCRGLADYFNFLFDKLIQTHLYALNFFDVLLFVFLGMEANDSLEDFVRGQQCTLLIDLNTQIVDVVLNLGIVLLDGVVVSQDGFGDFLLEVCEKSLDEDDHLRLGFHNAFFDIDLILLSCDSVLLDVLAAAVELLHCLQEERVQVVHHVGHVLEFAIRVILLVLLGMHSHTGRTQGQQTLSIFAEVEDLFLGVEGTALWLINLF